MVTRNQNQLATITILLSLFACKKDNLQDPSTISNASASNAYFVETIHDYDRSDNELLNAGWKKEWEENFNDGSLALWNVWEGGAYNNELQLYQRANLEVSGGVLAINAVKETKTGKTLPSDATPRPFNYTSGRIESKTLFSANPKTPKVRIAARIKLPTGYGMWPAFWSYGDPWPTQGEIDILEAKGQETSKFQTAYWYGRRAGQNIASGTEGFVTTSGDLTTGYHVYELIWEKQQLSFLIDGKLFEVKTGDYVSVMFNKKQQVTLNLAVGGNFFGPDFNPSQISTGTMTIDWVKVFTSK